VSLRRMRKGVRAARIAQGRRLFRHTRRRRHQRDPMPRTRRLCARRARIHSSGSRPLRCAGNTFILSLPGFSSTNQAVDRIPRRCTGSAPTVRPPYQNPRARAGRETGCPDSNARFRWDATVHRDTAVIMDERSRKDARPIGRTTYERPFRLPQHSQHLPFPFSHTRVEVGRPVMEG